MKEQVETRSVYDSFTVDSIITVRPVLDTEFCPVRLHETTVACQKTTYNCYQCDTEFCPVRIQETTFVC